MFRAAVEGRGHARKTASFDSVRHTTPDSAQDAAAFSEQDAGISAGAERLQENDQARPALLDWLLARLRLDPAVLDDPAIERQLGPMWRRAPARFRPYGRLMFALWGGRFIWFTLGLQVLMGIGLLYLVSRIALPQLHGWWPAAIPFMLGLGVVSGLAVSRRVEVNWSAAGGSFSFPSLWRAMLFLIPIFILRAALIVLINRGMTELLPLRNLLFFFVPGMLTTRATMLIVRLRRLQREFGSTAESVLSP